MNLEEKPVIQVSGVFPQLTVEANLLPVRSEIGIGALMPWAGRLWVETYVAHLKDSGSGSGLYEIGPDMHLVKRPESVVGTFANRMIHAPSHQLVIGPHLIDTDGRVRTVDGVKEHRLAATMEHLTDPKHKVCFLTMEGLLFEVNVDTLETKMMFDLIKELKIRPDAKPHFKGGFTLHGRMVVANNTYDESDYTGETADGRLAEWDGEKWTILEKKSFNEVTGRDAEGKAILATGQDRSSEILKVFVQNRWSTYRLPRGTHTCDNTVLTEWPRIREVETERYLMDAAGIFYELPTLAYEGKIWGVRPICTHLRMVPDFCSWRGMLVLGGDQVTPIWDSYLFAGQPQSNLWFGKTDDLWNFGKPSGWGGPWNDTAVKAGVPSDPFLMAGFDKKVLHLYHRNGGTVRFTVEVDVTGNQNWKLYGDFDVPADGYVHHEFPDGFSAHWVRVTSDTSCVATAYFHYS